METWIIVKILLGIIGTISISGTIIWWFVQLTATTLAENYKKKVEHEFERKLEIYKSQLEIIKANALKYNDKQFELYIDLWKNLQDLKFSCMELWLLPNQTNLKKFDTALKSTHRQIETTSILLEENHYIELSEIIRNLQEFDNGKEKLIIARRNQIPEQEINQIVEFNRERKDRCLEIIESMKSSIKVLIKGELSLPK